MNEEQRDPELESVRAEWQAPPPSAGFHARLLHAFEGEFGRVPWWRRRWPVAAMVWLPRDCSSPWRFSGQAAPRATSR